jgi:hypothetical protein
MAKINLSAKELKLVTDTSFILTKNIVIQKVYQLLGNLSEKYAEVFNAVGLSTNIHTPSPKISKGENYNGLPWVMLDYPRIFTKEDVFAVRTFFWWGNFFSITLQLSGKYCEVFKAQIEKLQATDYTEWYLCCNNNAWQHSFETGNYKLLRDFSTNEIKKLSFIKLAKKIPLQQWDDVALFLQNTYTELLQLLAAVNFPNDEIIL